jgi:hypothetical protein
MKVPRQCGGRVVMSLTEDETIRCSTFIYTSFLQVDWIPTWKIKTIKILGERIKDLCDLRLRKDFWNKTQKVEIHKDKLSFIVRKMKKEAMDWDSYSHNIYLKIDLYPEYINNLDDTIIKHYHWLAKLKLSKTFERTLHKRRYMNDQQALEKC